MNIFIYIIFLSLSLFSQEQSTFTIFNRLVLLNENEEIMLVKIKNVDFWVTPGVYQNKTQSQKEAFDEMIKSYGIQITDPKLHGTFNLHFKASDNVSVRNVYLAYMTSGTITLPEIIDEITWLPLDEALKKLSFPHISLKLEQVLKNKESIWAGSIIRYKENDAFKADILKAFYKIR